MHPEKVTILPLSFSPHNLSLKSNSICTSLSFEFKVCDQVISLAGCAWTSLAGLARFQSLHDLSESAVLPGFPNRHGGSHTRSRPRYGFEGGSSPWFIFAYIAFRQSAFQGILLGCRKISSAGRELIQFKS